MESKFIKFKVEIYDRLEYEEKESLGLNTSDVSSDIVDEYIDIFRIESFRKTYMQDSKAEAINIIMHSGESILIVITLEEFINIIKNHLDLA